MSIPQLLVGPPGIGKTASVRARYDYTEVLLLSSCTEEDIAGLPYREGTKERRTTPPFIERLQKNKAKNKCLFLDEIDKARREVADTLLTLITHPQEFGLPEDVEIIAAANPPEWGGGDGVSQPMLSRFAIIDYKPDLEFWVELTKKQFAHLPFIEKLMEKISIGEIPLLEANGEGFNFRLTCPRTWHLALQAISENKPELVTGLLTPNASSGLDFLTKKNEPLANENTIARKVGATKITSILRI